MTAGNVTLAEFDAMLRRHNWTAIMSSVPSTYRAAADRIAVLRVIAMQSPQHAALWDDWYSYAWHIEGCLENPPTPLRFWNCT